MKILLGYQKKRLFILGLYVLGWLSNGCIHANEKPPFTDYCQRLEQEIQGRKHGFLAGNVTYYVGGFHASWKLIEDESIGLTGEGPFEVRRMHPSEEILGRFQKGESVGIVVSAFRAAEAERLTLPTSEIKPLWILVGWGCDSSFAPYS